MCELVQQGPPRCLEPDVQHSDRGDSRCLTDGPSGRLKLQICVMFRGRRVAGSVKAGVQESVSDPRSQI